MSTLVDPRVIENETAKASPAQLAQYLQDTLGQKVTVYLAGLKDPKMVGRWASETNQPSDVVCLRLQYGYHVARLIEQAYGPQTVKSWLWGSNSRLDRKAPAAVLRVAQTPDDLGELVPAAIAFVADAD
jgi:hypothetical protein